MIAKHYFQILKKSNHQCAGMRSVREEKDPITHILFLSFFLIFSLFHCRKPGAGLQRPLARPH